MSEGGIIYNYLSLWDAFQLLSNSRRFLTPGVSKNLHHLIVAVFSLYSFDVEWTFDQLSLMIQQPFSTHDNLTIVTTVEAGYGDVQRVLSASQRLRSNNPASNCMLRLATSVLRNC